MNVVDAEKWKDAPEHEIHNDSNPSRNKFKKRPKWLSKWKAISLEELKKFMALQYVMAFIRLPQIKDYLSKPGFLSCSQILKVYEKKLASVKLRAAYIYAIFTKH
jgi:hypothetical protein